MTDRQAASAAGGHDHGGAAGDQAPHGRHHVGLRCAVQLAVGSSSRAGCVPYEARRGDALALARREPGSSFAEKGVRPWGSLATHREPAASTAAATAASDASGFPSRMLSPPTARTV